MASRIRLLLADDQVLFRQGLRTILESEPDLQVVGEAGDGLEAVELARTRQPDVVLMDIRMPRMDGVEATRRIREAGGTQVVILSTYDDELVFEALRVGAAGYLLKDFPAEELIKAIRTVHHGGGVLIPPPIAAKVVAELRRRGGDATPHEPLTAREEEILGLVARGLSNREIAETLYLSEGTVKNALSRIYAKLRARDRTQAALWAVQHGLARPAPD
jgi:DNA-binding NarL/FixJ family response regulator